MEGAQKWLKDGINLNREGKYAQAIECFDNAVLLNADEPNVFYHKGESLLKLEKYEQADLCYTQALAIETKLMPAYRGKYKALTALNKYHDIIEWCDIALSLDSDFHSAYYNKGRSLRALGKNKEALETYDLAIARNPNWAFPYTGKGHVLSYLCKYDEAIACYDKSIALDPTDPAPLNGKAKILTSLARAPEAIHCYNKLILLVPNGVLYLCNRGKLLSSLGQTKESLEDFKKARDLVLSGHTDVELSPENLDFLKNTLKSILELDDIAAQTTQVIHTFGEDNPRIKKFVDNIKVLQEDKRRVIGNLIAKFDEIEIKEDEDLLIDFKYQKDDGLLRVNSKPEQKAEQKFYDKDLDSQVERLKEEINKEVGPLKQKLYTELEKLNISSEDKTVLIDYCKGFTETFVCIYITSEVVYSGQTDLKDDRSKSIILSAVASLIPFLEVSMSEGIQSVKEFLLSKEMKANARKIRGLAAEPSELSQLVWRVGLRIILDSNKQKQILDIANDDLKESSDKTFTKLTKLCESSHEIDAYLYSRIYKNPPARLAHIDANFLIQEWINMKVDPYNVQNDFVTKTVKQNFNKKVPKQKGSQASLNDVDFKLSENKQSNACNMF